MHCPVVIVLGIVDTAHHALVVAEEEYGQASEGIDKMEEAVGVVVVG